MKEYNGGQLYGTSPEMALCAHVNNLSMVSAEPILYCSDLRYNPENCGKEAAFFEPIKSEAHVYKPLYTPMK